MSYVRRHRGHALRVFLIMAEGLRFARSAERLCLT